MSDMVVDKVGIGRAGANPLRSGMEGWSHFEFDTLRPDRIVVVLTVQPKCVEPRRRAIREAILLHGFNRTAQQA